MPIGRVCRVRVRRMIVSSERRLQMYNRWLVDSRRGTSASHRPRVPTDVDIDRAIAEVEWAHDHGLKGVNFPALRGGEILEYNNPAWDPFWAVCEERNLPLVTRRRRRHRQVRRRRGDGDHVVRVGQLLFARRGVVASSRACRTVPAVEARDHRDAGQVVSGPGRRARRDPEHVLDATEMNATLLTKRCRPPSEYRSGHILGASFASAVRRHSRPSGTGYESQLLGFRLPARRRHVRLPGPRHDAVGDAARPAQHVLQHPAGAHAPHDRRERHRRVRPRSPGARRDRRGRSAHRRMDELGTPMETVPEGRGPPPCSAADSGGVDVTADVARIAAQLKPRSTPAGDAQAVCESYLHEVELRHFPRSLPTEWSTAPPEGCVGTESSGGEHALPTYTRVWR